MNIERLSQLIATIHRTTLEPGVWPEAMRAISDAFDSTISGLVARDLSSNGYPFAVLDPRSPLAPLEAYQAYYGSIDAIAAAMQRRPEGEVVTEQMILQHEPLRRSEAWNDFYLRCGFDHQIGGYAINDGRMAASLVIYRDASRSAFDDDEVRQMQLILPHVSLALRTALQLRMSEQRAGAAGDALEILDSSVLLLDGSGRVVWMNRAARSLVENPDVLSLDRGTLVAATESDSTRLRQAVQACASPLPDALPQRIELRRTAGPPLILFVTPITPDSLGISHAVCMVVIRGDDRSDEDQIAKLRRLWGLTAAESALACALSEGKTLQEIAADRSVTVETVRTQVKRVFLKTGTRRQAEIIRLVLGSSGMPRSA